MIVATTDTIAEHRIVATVGQVFGIAVRTRGIEGNIAAGFARLGMHNGDPVGEYAGTLSDARDDAVAQMVLKAAAVGANAIVAMRFAHASVGHDIGEILAYGTAVIVEPTA